MLMTAPEKLILENQAKILSALSVLLRASEHMPSAHMLSAQCSKTYAALQTARTFAEH